MSFSLTAIYLDVYQHIDAQLNSWFFNDIVTHQFLRLHCWTHDLQAMKLNKYRGDENENPSEAQIGGNTG